MPLADRIKRMSVAWFSFNLATSAIVLSSFALSGVSHIPSLTNASKNTRRDKHSNVRSHSNSLYS
jgi:hypothetical protein